MKLLFATPQTQGQRTDDCFEAEDGELVIFGPVCPREPIGGPCGCKRSMYGAKSGRMTTTFAVKEHSGTDQQVCELIYEALLQKPWTAEMMISEVRTLAAKQLKHIRSITDRFDVDEVIERRGSKFRCRAITRKPDKRSNGKDH